MMWLYRPSRVPGRYVKGEALLGVLSEGEARFVDGRTGHINLAKIPGAETSLFGDLQIAVTGPSKGAVPRLALGSNPMAAAPTASVQNWIKSGNENSRINQVDLAFRVGIQPWL